MISADSHVIAPEACRSINKKKYGEHRIPTLVRKTDSRGERRDVWCIAGKGYIKNAGVTRAGERFEDKPRVARRTLWDTALQGNPRFQR